MTKGIEALVKPELLIWARASAGMSASVAADKLKIAVDKLEQWESGDLRPTINQLRKLGTLYKRPIAVFYLPSPPKTFDAMRDFRRLPHIPLDSSPQLTFAIREARNRREQALDLYEAVEGTPQWHGVTVNLSDDPESVSTKLRNFLTISIEQQQHWKDIYTALNSWRAAIESKNILVFQASNVPVEEMRGFSISEFPLPAIVMNVKDAPAARIFTLMHELTHIMLRKDGICDLAGNSQGGAAIETFCNRVAAAILVPKESLLSESELAPQQKINYDNATKALASRYKVSKQVILGRLLSLGKITNNTFQPLIRQYEEEFRALAKQESGPVKVPTQVINRGGRLFSRLVLQNYYQDRITASDVSDLLSVRLKHLADIEQAISEGYRH